VIFWDLHIGGAQVKLNGQQGIGFEQQRLLHGAFRLLDLW
jgi:hypothetical protein